MKTKRGCIIHFSNIVRLYLALFFIYTEQAQAQEHKIPVESEISQEMLLYHQSMMQNVQDRSGANAGKAYYNLLTAGPLERDQYFYIDTQIPFSALAAPQIHITGYNYGHPNRAIKLTLGWYYWAGTWHFTQYRCDLGYYNPSRIRLGTYNDGGTEKVRIEIANDGTYWSSYTFSATDHRGNETHYQGWSYDTGEMPASTNNIITVQEYGYVNVGSSSSPVTLTVAGGIRTREIKVEANAGADFVFSDDYHLRPLTEVEQFISFNKHLPDIVPADSMVQNGVDVGEFQIKLLQKIEELTLYVIEQQRQIEILKEEIKENESEER